MDELRDELLAVADSSLDEGQIRLKAFKEHLVRRVVDEVHPQQGFLFLRKYEKLLQKSYGTPVKKYWAESKMCLGFLNALALDLLAHPQKILNPKASQ